MFEKINSNLITAAEVPTTDVYIHAAKAIFIAQKKKLVKIYGRRVFFKIMELNVKYTIYTHLCNFKVI